MKQLKWAKQTSDVDGEDLLAGGCEAFQLECSYQSVIGRWRSKHSANLADIPWIVRCFIAAILTEPVKLLHLLFLKDSMETVGAARASYPIVLDLLSPAHS